VDIVLVSLYRTLDELTELSVKLQCARNDASTKDACDHVRAAIAHVRAAMDAAMAAKAQSALFPPSKAR